MALSLPVAQYDATAQYYEDNGLTVQAIAVRKKAEKAKEQLPKPSAEPGKTEPLFESNVPRSPLFEILGDAERDALIGEMEVETHDEGSVIINEGDPGSSMYVIASGAVKVYTRSATGTASTCPASAPPRSRRGASSRAASSMN